MRCEADFRCQRNCERAHDLVLCVHMSPLPNVTIELIPDRELGGFTAFIPNVPALGEGETEEEAIKDLEVCLQGYIEHYGMEDVLSRIIAPTQIRQVNLGELVHG